MPSMLVHTFVCVLTVLGHASTHTTETVVAVAGRQVTLPCRADAEKRGDDVEVCWGRGEASVFACRDTVLYATKDRISYRRSYRYSMSPSSSLSIALTRASDSGFYHCRVQLPGLFNDQTTSVHLIVIVSPHSVLTTTDAAAATGVQRGQTGDAAGDTGSDVTGTTQPMTALVQSVQQKQEVNGPQTFIGNTLRLSFIVFIPVMLLTAAYRVWGCGQRAKNDRRLDQSEDEDRHTRV